MKWLKEILSYLNRYSVGRNLSIRPFPNRPYTKKELIELINKLDGVEARNKDNI